MNILILSWELFPLRVGGLGKVVYYISRYLHKFGNTVHLILPWFYIKFSDSIEEILKKGERKIIKVLSSYDVKYIEIISKKKYDPFVYFGDILKNINKYIDFCLNTAKKIRFDVIYAHDWVTFPAAIELKKKYKKPLVIHLHSTSIDRAGGNFYPFLEDYKVEKKAVEIADKIIVVSRRLKTILEKYYNANPKKIEVVYNAPDEKSLVRKISKKLKRKKWKIVLFVGRLTIQKGPDWFLRAAKEVLRKRDDVLFVVVGSGEMYEQLINLAAELEISDHVIFTGRVSDEELELLYDMADVFVMPSVSEPFGLVPLEAINHKVPVIISKQSGVSEILRNALTVDFWDTKLMANYILALLEYPSLRSVLVERLQEDIKNINWKNQVKKIEEILSKLISQ